LINEQNEQKVGCNTRPDLASSIGLLSRFMQNLGVSHMIAVKRILRYIKGKVYEVLFSNNDEIMK
jgi:hypothetical protein